MTLWDDLDKAYAEVESLLVELPPGNARDVVRMLVGQVRGCAKRLRLLSQASREHLAARAQDIEETRAETIEECAAKAARMGREWGLLRSMKMTYYAEAAAKVAAALREMKP